MKARFYFLLPFFLIIYSCQENEEPIGEEEIFWVYSYPVPCFNMGTNQTTCLGVSKTSEFDFEWEKLERIQLEIEGFTFKPFFIQKIQVQKFKNLDTKKITTKLIRVLEEERDYYDLLEGSWRVKRYEGADLPNPSFPKGQTANLIPGVRKGVSTDGCNQIEIQINKVSPNKITSFGDARSTSRACNPQQTIIPFPGLSNNFKREGNILTFYNDEGGEVAVWEKVN